MRDPELMARNLVKRGRRLAVELKSHVVVVVENQMGEAGESPSSVVDWARHSMQCRVTVDAREKKVESPAFGNTAKRK
jgi:hypothetical protein